MHLNVLRRHHCQQRLDNLQLNALVGLRAHETVADRGDDAVDEELSGVCRVRDIPGEMPVGDQLLQTVQGGDNDPRSFALTRELKGQEILFSVDGVGGVVLGQRQRRGLL